MRPVRLRFAAEAREHIAKIYSYIWDSNRTAATEVIARIRYAAEQLADFPRMGHAGRVPSTHEWVVRGLPYVIVYQMDADDPDEVLILGVFHGAQDREQE